MPDGCDYAGAAALGAVVAAASSGPQTVAGGALAATTAMGAAAYTERVCRITAPWARMQLERALEQYHIWIDWIDLPYCTPNPLNCATPFTSPMFQYDPGVDAFVKDAWEALSDGFAAEIASGSTIVFSVDSLSNSFGDSFDANVYGTLDYYEGVVNDEPPSVHDEAPVDP